MSDTPFAALPMRPEQARDISHGWLRAANHLRDIAGKPGEIKLAERRSQRWLTYAIALAQTQPPEDC